MKRLSVYQHGTKIFQDESESYYVSDSESGILVVTNKEIEVFYISLNDTFKIETIDGELQEQGQYF
jgi:membrane-anchored protein YejM (alkaline phosphatase superfamily)